MNPGLVPPAKPGGFPRVIVMLVLVQFSLSSCGLVFLGWTPPLHRAAKAGDADMVRQLLNAGADIEVREAFEERLQWTALHWAAFRGDQEIAELLIFRGAELDARAYATPLYLAAEQGELEVIKLLVAAGAEVNVKSDWQGYTPLHRAAVAPVVLRIGPQGDEFGGDRAARYKQIVEVLLARGAEINARDNDGNTALDEAIWAREEEVAALLRRHGGKTSAELQGQERVPGEQGR